MSWDACYAILFISCSRNRQGNDTFIDLKCMFDTVFRVTENCAQLILVSIQAHIRLVAPLPCF